MDDVFKALADPSRRALLDDLKTRDGQTLTELASRLSMARQSVTKHLHVLEAANLITTVRRGREKLHFLNAAPINAISERWIHKYDRERIAALADLKTALERTAMTESDFVYTTYIEAPPELVWQGLTDPAFTRRYWGMEFETDWTPGSPFAVLHTNRGIRIGDDEMVVKEYEPYSRLSYTWQTYTQEFARSLGLSEEKREHAAAEPRSTVTYELTPQGEETRLTVTHSGFRPGSVVLPDISRGWPMVLSGLKTFLESGRWQQAA
ncbi:metalloregulator ArsR/SmtB family transcription factor [Amnibacterium sp.]|uniref:ArsR/SmtB family transcription factor n=1 Tax=Amnibacterium sp. TaxID=1872496 RepID=UPI002625396F|nr:metalloregulator ArsR/SmtB family transcription factor [Amnibacterium sp.]MCU1474880.1 ArsR family transcriptional regulator [Amnibacterium sp.]